MHDTAIQQKYSKVDESRKVTQQSYYNLFSSFGLNAAKKAILRGQSLSATTYNGLKVNYMHDVFDKIIRIWFFNVIIILYHITLFHHKLIS